MALRAKSGAINTGVGGVLWGSGSPRESNGSGLDAWFPP